MAKIIVNNTFRPGGIRSIETLTDNINVVNLNIPIGKLQSENIDFDLHNLIETEFIKLKFDAIFIPVTIGKPYSDLLGLRLGLHLRFTKGVNQLTHIIFYSSVSIEEIGRSSELSEIIFQKGSTFCRLSKAELRHYLDREYMDLSSSDLFSISKSINIPHPSSLLDRNHSISNIWGAERLAALAKIDLPKKEHQKTLFFKWLHIHSQTTDLREEDLKNNLIVNSTANGLIDNGIVRVLFVDDEFKNGWDLVLEEILNIVFGAKKFILDFAENENEAIEKLKKEYSLIILDLRFGEEEHQEDDIEKFTGFRLLKKCRTKWGNANFSTPILMFTASNKIWILNKLIEAGADAYYIKENPEISVSKNFTIQNYYELKQNFLRLRNLGEKKKKVKSIVKEINRLVSQSIRNENIKSRITEKMKIGYGILFRKAFRYEKEELLFNNEILAFVVFWSILEEISKDFFGRKNDTDRKWIIHKINKDVSSDLNVSQENSVIPLSMQISVLLKYLHNGNTALEKDFRENLNRYRNKIDFIHSSTDKILNSRLSEFEEDPKAFDKCLEMLNFIRDILSLKTV